MRRLLFKYLLLGGSILFNTQAIANDISIDDIEWAGLGGMYNASTKFSVYSDWVLPIHRWKIAESSGFSGPSAHAELSRYGIISGVGYTRKSSGGIYPGAGFSARIVVVHMRQRSATFETKSEGLLDYYTGAELQTYLGILVGKLGIYKKNKSEAGQSSTAMLSIGIGL